MDKRKEVLFEMRKKLKMLIDKIELECLNRRLRRNKLRVVRKRLGIINNCINILIIGNEFIDEEKQCMIKAVEKYKEQVSELNCFVIAYETRLRIFSNVSSNDDTKSE